MADRVDQALTELITIGGVQPGAIIVFGVSTSEVAGQHIGTSGSMEIASAIYEGVQRARAKAAFYPVFQCCEHLNRALVMERELLLRHPDYEPVSVIPVRNAGGAMAAFAYRHLTDPVVVEAVRAHAGVDIGATLIGMHLRPVAVPVRPTVKQIGAAALQMAYSRPKLIGGPRAVYDSRVILEAGNCD
ncbi:MAG: TIGR01440 family protein [Gorillibacterium sp.]|nr:TIGR01440 family protein [Gorillibacterium sp.]